MKKFKSNYIFYIIGVFCVVLLLISAVILDIIEINNNEFIIIDESSYISNDNYKIQINYPILKNNKTNERIKKIINNEKETFLNRIKNSNTYENELNINYSYNANNDLYSIHIRSYSYTGSDNKYHRKDNIIYYDTENNKEIKNSDLIVNNKIYEVFRNECYDYLINNVDKYKLYDKSIITNRLVADKNNYELLLFNEDNIEIIFEPHSISEYDNEIIIKINYSKVIDYLNNNYFKEINIKDEETTNNINRNYNRIRDSKYFENKKIIALTFDDGPSYEKTEKLVDELEKRNARVSFFMLGELAYKQEDLVKKIYENGHTIGSHTYDHKNLKKLDDEQLSFEVNYTNEILSNIIGEDIKFIRPPYGAYNEDILKKTNMAFILWNVDTLDWQLRNAEKVRDYVVEHADDGDIILLHDIHSTTIDGIIMAIDILKEQGYEFVSLEEMLVYKNINIQTNKAYRFFK